MKRYLWLLCNVLLGLSLGLPLLGCTQPLSLGYLKSLNQKAYAGRICGVPKGERKDIHFFAVNVAMGKVVTDRHPEALRNFMPLADSVHEVSSWAPVSSAKTVPISMEVSCPARTDIPPDLQAEFDKVVASSCKSTAPTRPDSHYVGQTYVDGRNPLAGTELKLVGAVLTWALQEADAEDPRIERPANIKMPLRPPMELLPLTEGKAPLTLEDPRVQFGSGAAAGATIGAVPFGPMGADVAIELRLLPQGTYWARVGKACGEIVVGTGQMILGCAGMGTGIGMSGTGGGAPAGVLVFSGSYAIAANGCATTIHSLGELSHLRSEGNVPSGSSAPAQEHVVLKPKPVQQHAPQPAVPETHRTVAPPKPAAVPAETTTITKYKDTGKTVTKRAGGTTTTTTPAPTQATTPVNNPANSGTTTVYRSVNQATGEVQYVGLTDDFARRRLEHLRKSGFAIEEFITGLSRSDARAVEQALIEIHGLGKNGGTLLNKINSIAKTNPNLAQLLQRGYDLIKAAKPTM